jgi:hypothetical protein
LNWCKKIGMRINALHALGHLHGGDQASQDATTNGDVAGERALLVDEVGLDGLCELKDEGIGKTIWVVRESSPS